MGPNEEREELESRLAAFYEKEAADRARRPLSGERQEARRFFVDLLRTEKRGSILDVGAGPGHDVGPMVEAGLAVAAVDLSNEHVAFCKAKGADAHVASLFDLPFADEGFSAGWTMSTLLHVPDDRVDDALTEISRCLTPGAPLAVGVWGGHDEERIVDDDRFEPHRFFAHRSDERLRSMLSAHGDIEHWQTWPSPHLDEIYQFCVLRTPEPPAKRVDVGALDSICEDWPD